MPGQTGTVVLFNSQPYSTFTSYGAVSTAATYTSPPPAPGQTGIVMVLMQQPYTTITSYGGVTAESTTTIEPSSPGQTGTPYTTVTSWGSFSTSGTTTLSPTSPGGTATVVMQKPQPYTTVTTYATVSSVSTSTGTPASAGQTATVVVVAPAVGTKVADQTCNNAGLEYAIYTNPYTNGDPPKYSALDVSHFATTAPTYNGVTRSIGITEPGGVKAGNSGPAQVIYPGSPSQTWQYKAVNHRAFLYAPINGTYSVVVPYSDEVTLVWFGNKALSTWTRANADLQQNYSSGPSSSMTFKIQLTAGTYTPFRVFWANAQGDYSMIITVTAPDGTVIVDGSGSSSQYFVRFACDSSTPSYPAFGSGG
ncbi:GLEYA domain-containing protein [Fusarium oxysporum Fo47]|uniref:GLEYA domain-containing protein n=1 Tax=Fusarium oxysporum Fo47 TaxID=660027 RepID=UPI002869832F|nr:GLEYA domain-containing protein [Fusarium oxysporum Fo47]QKD57945.2 GLEYA domain-domain-containing protein [Fusarium oxysporum Fo47]